MGCTVLPAEWCLTSICRITEQSHRCVQTTYWTRCQHQLPDQGVYITLKTYSVNVYIHGYKMVRHSHTSTQHSNPCSRDGLRTYIILVTSGVQTVFSLGLFSVVCTTCFVWCTTLLVLGTLLHHLVWIAIMIFIVQLRLISNWPKPYSASTRTT